MIFDSVTLCFVPHSKDASLFLKLRLPVFFSTNLTCTLQIKCSIYVLLLSLVRWNVKREFKAIFFQSRV